MTKLLGTDDLERMAWDAEDMDREVLVHRSAENGDLIVSVEIDGEEYWNDLLDVELDDTGIREARRYYYG